MRSGFFDNIIIYQHNERLWSLVHPHVYKNNKSKALKKEWLGSASLMAEYCWCIGSKTRTADGSLTVWGYGHIAQFLSYRGRSRRKNVVVASGRSYTAMHRKQHQYAERDVRKTIDLKKSSCFYGQVAAQTRNSRLLVLRLLHS